jgi:hypothetical protein
MFGLTEKLAVAAVVVSAGYGGVKHIEAANLKASVQRAQAAEDVARGELATCGARLANLMEAADSNASIPDDLSDFDIPDSWMQP